MDPTVKVVVRHHCVLLLELEQLVRLSPFAGSPSGCHRALTLNQLCRLDAGGGCDFCHLEVRPGLRVTAYCQCYAALMAWGGGAIVSQGASEWANCCCLTETASVVSGGSSTHLVDLVTNIGGRFLNMTKRTNNQEKYLVTSHTNSCLQGVSE